MLRQCLSSEMLNVFARATGFVRAKNHPEEQPKSFNSLPNNPTAMSQHEAITKQKRALRHQTAQVDLNIAMYRLPQNLIGGKKRGKKQEKTYIWEWIIFMKLLFFPLPALTLLLWYPGAMVQPSQPPQSPGTKQPSRISLKGWLGFV